MASKFTFKDVVLLTVLPRGTDADEYDCSPALHWIEQHERGYFSPFAEHILPEQIVDLTAQRKEDVLVSVIDYTRDCNLADEWQGKNLVRRAMQAGLAFKTIPEEPRNVIIIPGTHEGVRLARKLISLDATMLYSNAEAFRHVPAAVPFNSFRVFPPDYKSEDDEREDFCYLGTIPEEVKHDFLIAELENINGNNCFDLALEFGIKHSWRTDLMDFLSFGQEEVKGIGSMGHVNTDVYFSIPISIRQSWEGYDYYHAAAQRAQDVFYLWEVGQAMYASETGEPFNNLKEGKRERAAKESDGKSSRVEEEAPEYADPDARPYLDNLNYDAPDDSWIDDEETLERWKRRAEEIGIEALIDAYYSGVPMEDIIGGSDGELGMYSDGSGRSIVPLFI